MITEKMIFEKLKISQKVKANEKYIELLAKCYKNLIDEIHINSNYNVDFSTKSQTMYLHIKKIPTKKNVERYFLEHKNFISQINNNSTNEDEILIRISDHKIYQHEENIHINYVINNWGELKGAETMKLYKNIDVCDIEKILQEGILSIEKCGNDNWGENKRTRNSKSVVYLFNPKSEINSFPEYGVVLLECNVEAFENEIGEKDCHKNLYDEYITSRVRPEQITNVYIPKLFKNRIALPKDIMSKITWCDLKANHYNENGKENCPDDVLEQFAKTAEIMDASEFNFFRGRTEKKNMIDLYDVQYIWR